jgi:hypothetical protein
MDVCNEMRVARSYGAATNVRSERQTGAKPFRVAGPLKKLGGGLGYQFQLITALGGIDGCSRHVQRLSKSTVVPELGCPNTQAT